MPLSNTDIVSDELLTATNGVHARPGAIGSENSVSGRADNPASPFRGYFHQLKELKKRYPHLKILISLEGNPADFAIDAKPENRRAFVASCIDTFIRGRFAPGIHEPGIFDGVDIDWESPHIEDAANFLELLEEFRRTETGEESPNSQSFFSKLKALWEA